MLRKCALCFLLLVPAGGAVAGQHGPAATVYEITKPSTCCYVLRNGMRVPLSYEMELANGDKLVVNDAHAAITIRYANKSKKVVSKADSPFTVSGSLKKATPWSNILNALWEDVTRSSDDWAVTTSTRGSADDIALDLRIPGLVDGSATIAAGRRHMVIEWIGGQSPFSLVLRDAAGRRLEEETNISFDSQKPLRRFRITTHMTDFTPGRYVVELTDARNVAVRGTFRAVATGVPAPVACEPNASLAECATTAAALLAIKRDHRWAYESLLRLYDGLDQKWTPAIELSDWIAKGER